MKTTLIPTKLSHRFAKVLIFAESLMISLSGMTLSLEDKFAVKMADSLLSKARWSSSEPVSSTLPFRACQFGKQLKKTCEWLKKITQ